MEKKEGRTFILFGDSNTRRGVYPGNWAQVLAEALVGEIDVLNRGFGGYTSRTILPWLHNIGISSTSNPPSLITLSFGSNDCCTNPMFHVPIDEYEKNMKIIIEFLLGIKDNENYTHSTFFSKRLILILPPPIEEDLFKKCFNEVNRSNSILSPYIDVCRKLVKEYNLSVIDPKYLLENHEEITTWTEDGLHLSGKIGTLIAEAIIKIYTGLERRDWGK